MHALIEQPTALCTFGVVLPCCVVVFLLARSAARQRGRCLGEEEPHVVIKAAWERLCWESIFPCVEYSIIL